jgi:hypothetical protein
MVEDSLSMVKNLSKEAAKRDSPISCDMTRNSETTSDTKKRKKKLIRVRVRQLDSSAHGPWSDDPADSTEIKEALRRFREFERASKGGARVGRPMRRSGAGQIVSRRPTLSKNRRSKPHEPDEQLPADEPHHRGRSSSRGPQAWSQSEDKPRNGRSRSLSRGLDSRTHSAPDTSFFDGAFDAKMLNEKFGSFLSGPGRRQTSSLRRWRASSQPRGLQCRDMTISADNTRLPSCTGTTRSNNMNQTATATGKSTSCRWSSQSSLSMASMPTRTRSCGNAAK